MSKIKLALESFSELIFSHGTGGIVFLKKHMKTYECWTYYWLYLYNIGSKGYDRENTKKSILLTKIDKELFDFCTFVVNERKFI